MACRKILLLSAPAALASKLCQRPKLLRLYAFVLFFFFLGLPSAAGAATFDGASTDGKTHYSATPRMTADSRKPKFKYLCFEIQL